MTPDPSAAELVVRRIIPVPRERVFAAWLDAASIARWMCPGEVARTTARIDPRVGGCFVITMEHGRGGAEHWGEYLVIDPPSRLEFTWSSAATDRRPTLVTVEFLERAGGSTEVVLTHRRLPDAQIGPHTRGWTDIVRKLGDLLELRTDN